MNESILRSVSKDLGIDYDDTSFDSEIIRHINSIFFILEDLGIGPAEGFEIEDETAVWSDFINEPSNKKLRAVKTFVYLRVKILFDPPANSTALESLKSTAAEYEWRLANKK